MAFFMDVIRGEHSLVVKPSSVKGVTTVRFRLFTPYWIRLTVGLASDTGKAVVRLNYPVQDALVV